MFMLTHTYFLQKVLKRADLKDVEPDVYVYNIAPDLLAIHPQITPDKTHRLRRALQIPPRYSKSAYVIFHLLVDDLSHHGHICLDDLGEFNLNSQGYSYLKGRHLVDSILEVHRMIHKDISYADAVYQSHLIIEMIYDLVILKEIYSYKTIDLLVEAFNFTIENKMDEFIETIGWLYRFDKKEIEEVMKGALLFMTKEGMESLMNMKGRINLYRDKFGLESNERLFCDGLESLFHQAVNLIDDEELFFSETVEIIKNYNRLPFIT